MSNFILVGLTFGTIILSANVSNLKDVIYKKGNSLEFELRSLRYNRTLSHVVYNCSISVEPTISCTDKVMDCIDNENNKVGHFDFMRSYSKCERLIQRTK